MNTHIKLYRQRFIPQEIIFLKDDLVLFADDNLILTKWNCIKPRTDISYGYSAYCLDHGFKISKIFDSHDQLVYWYCDIITDEYNVSDNALTIIDLLIDIVIYEDGSVHVIDLDELADCLHSGLISSDLASLSLHTANSLLAKIYDGSITYYQNLINSYVTMHPHNE